MIYGKRYKIQKEDAIIIYGAATTGAIIFKNLYNSGCRVIAFLDERAEEISNYYQLPVWNLKNQIHEKISKETIIIVAVKNVFEHEKIAKKLWNLGYTKIIFRPYQCMCGKGNENDWLLNAAYDKIFSGEVEVEGKCIQAFEKSTLKNAAIIEEIGEYVIANIPVPFIFTDKKGKGDNLWSDIPCLGLIPHLGLFLLFSGIYNDDYKEYMLYCREAAQKSGGIITSKAWEESVYKNRLDVFNHMQYSWEHDREFFVRNAVEGRYNENGYFNINSGKHRIAFQIVKGSRYIPLRIKRTDFEKWSEKEKAENILDYLYQNNTEALPIFLKNPYLYHYPTEAGLFYENILYNMLFRLFQKAYYQKLDFAFEGKKILFYNTPMALYSSIFKLLGFKVYIVEENRKNYFLLRELLKGIEYVYLNDSPEEVGSDCTIAIVEGDNSRVIGDINIKIGAAEVDTKHEEILSCGIVQGHIMKAWIGDGL